MNLVAPPPYPQSQKENSRSSGTRMGKSSVKKLSSRTLSIESNSSSEGLQWTATLGAKIGQPPVERKPKNLRRQSSERNQRSPRRRDKPRRRSSHTSSSSSGRPTKTNESREQVATRDDSFAGDAFPDIVQVMRRASNEIKKALRRDLLSRFKQTPAYVHANNHKVAFWFEAIPATPGDWSCFKGLPTSGYSKFYSYATKEMEYGTYLNFLTAARELESLECQSGEYRYLLKFYEIFTSFIDVQLPAGTSKCSISLEGNSRDDEASMAAGLAEMKIEMGSEVIKSLEKAHARYFGSSLDRVMASDDEHEGMLIFEAKGWYSSDDSMF